MNATEDNTEIVACHDCGKDVYRDREVRTVNISDDGEVTYGPLRPNTPVGPVRCYECGRDNMMGESK